MANKFPGHRIRPQAHTRPYRKLNIVMYTDQVQWLDKLAHDMKLTRSGVLRAMVEKLR